MIGHKSQMIGHKEHEAAMFKTWSYERNYTRMLQLMTFWDCASFHNVKTCKTTFVTKKDKPT